MPVWDDGIEPVVATGKFDNDQDAIRVLFGIGLQRFGHHGEGRVLEKGWKVHKETLGPEMTSLGVDFQLLARGLR